MANDEQQPPASGEPGSGSGKQPAQPTRIPLSSDPTHLIKLSRPTPPPPTPTELLPAASADPAKPWTGDEQTLVGTPVHGSSTPTPKDGTWAGDEQTLVGTPTPAAQTETERWTGDEKTMVGTPIAAKPQADAGSRWVGDEATQLGMATDAKPRGEGGTTTNATKTPTKTTNPAFDDGWHLKGRQGPLTGTTLGDFEMGGVLGEGGMGIVYRAKQISLKRRAAVKVLPSNLAADMRLRARFEQEARTASLLNTPHVVQVYGAGTIDDVVYFAMEYVDGTDLSAIIHEKRDKQEPFKAEEAANYVIQAARGLAEASKHNIVHRDIKPANLMITSKGVVKIADFGISKVAGEHGMTMTGTAVGTPAYCSPEQGRGDQVDPRADIYSLGVVLYELLSGRKPFDGTTANALIYQHNYQEPKLLTELRSDLPQAYQAVCLKCLMKDPAQRYQDAAELVQDLESARDGSMTVTAVFQAKFGTGAEEAMAKYLGVRRRWWVKYGVAAVLLVGVGVGGVWWWTSQQALQQRQEETRLAQVKQRKDALAPLDKAAPIPRSAKDDLAWLRKEVPKDADLKRWQDKLDRVGKLQAGLTALDGGELPDAQAQRTLREQLTAYGDEVGAGEDVQRWQARLAQATKRGEDLRTQLNAELEPVATPGFALRERLRPTVGEFVRLSGTTDPDGQRWSKRLDAVETEAASIRKTLAVLDDEKAVVNEADNRRFTATLQRLGEIVSPQDHDLARWSAKLRSLGEGLESLRRTLATALAGDKAMTLTQLDDVRPYLDRYRAQVSAEDPQLIAWTRRMEESAARIATLRKALGSRLDPRSDGKIVALSEAALTDLKGRLEQYAALVPVDDAQFVAWSGRLAQERSAIVADTKTLEAVDRKERMSVVVRTACEQALARLDARAAVAADRKATVQRRIAEEKVNEETLRKEVLARTADQSLAYAPETTQLLDELERIAGRADPDVKTLRGQYAKFLTLRDALLPLEQVVPIPPAAAQNLDALAKIVGEGSDQVRRWRAKLARVRTLTEALKGSEAVVPQPDNALANATELVTRWVGSDDPQAAAWLAKATKVAELRARLSAAFGDEPGSTNPANQVLPSGSTLPRDAEELAALTGDSEAEVRHWRHRARILVGPDKPAWAARSGRDAYGPWVELDLGDEIVQRLRYIPAGTFTIGSPGTEAGRDEDEPQIPGITITRSLWLSDSECTQAFWTTVMGENPSRFKRADDAPERPVERVSWNDVQGFLAALIPRLGEAKARLPTEAEWEYACRAGVTGPYADYTGEITVERLDTAAWFGLRDGTRGVRRRAPNRFGLFDLHGNVWEWCQDRSGTYSAADTIDPIGRQEDTRIARGGSWADPATSLRAANRLALNEGLRTLYVGFRFAIPVEWKPGTEPPTATGDLHAAK